MRNMRMMTLLLAGCATFLLVAAPGLTAQAAQGHQHAATATAKTQAGMAAKCEAMMAEHQKMMTETKAADQRLDDLVAAMNTASGQAKADAAAAVLNEMVSQRRTMREGMMKMQQDMMGHMMEHMQAGKDSMAMCPMMKQMGGMKP